MRCLFLLVVISALAMVVLVGGCVGKHSVQAGGSSEVSAEVPAEALAAPEEAPVEKATFAGGNFWCMEPPFERLEGVISVVAGYIGGSGEAPTYEDYAQKGHVEAVEITYDPGRITYSQLLEVFWRQINPTDDGGQFVDRGPQYRSAIFYHTEDQRRLAELSKQAVAVSGRFDKPIMTEIIEATPFYMAEEYHQDYYKNHVIKYEYYRSRSRRDSFLDMVWGKDRDVTLQPQAVSPPAVAPE